MLLNLTFNKYDLHIKLKLSDIHVHSNHFLGSYEKISYSKTNVTFLKFKRKKSLCPV